MEQGLIEKIAKALQKRRDVGDFNITCKGVRVIKDPYIEMARAALCEMRTPTKRMLKAACAAMSPGKRPTVKRVSVKAKHGIRYRAMIDAELGDA